MPVWWCPRPTRHIGTATVHATSVRMAALIPPLNARVAAIGKYNGGVTQSSTGAILFVSIPDWDDRCRVSRLASFVSRSDKVAGSERKCGRNCRLTNLRRAPEEDFFPQQPSPGGSAGGGHITC